MGHCQRNKKNSPTTDAWSRTFKKYSPSQSSKFSPVISCQGKLAPFILSNDRAKTTTWLLTTTEEYYYQNILELMSIHDKGLSRINGLLRKNRISDFWPNVLLNFQFLGKGNFGDVYKATDKRTDQVYAVKQIKSSTNICLYDTLSVLLERNAYIRANESQFIVKLYGAFQDTKSHWMVFEYCIGDLLKYLEAIFIPAVTFMDKFIEDNVITGLYDAYKMRVSLDIETIAFIYAFELLAGLDYMAKRILVHRDLKPDNILLSTTGHLKIGDLGLTQRLRWIDRKTTIDMVEPTALKDLEKLDYHLTFSGNRLYSDPETLIFYQLELKSQLVYDRIDSVEFPIQSGDQNFLSDLYSVSLIIMELLFAGMNFITTHQISADVANSFGVRTSSKTDMILFKYRCMFDEEVRFNYLTSILNNQSTSTNMNLLTFLKSCYQPRRYRAARYTRDMRFYQNKELVRGRCIDIERIEEMELYKSRNITVYNVNRIPIPDTVLNFYKKNELEIQGLTFKDFQAKIHPDDETCGVDIPSFRYVE